MSRIKSEDFAKKIANRVVHSGELGVIVRRAVEEYENGNLSISEISGRICCDLVPLLGRYAADTEMLNWLELHRCEWDRITVESGRLRRAVADEMQRCGDI